jgi:hypothetical protein
VRACAAAARPYRRGQGDRQPAGRGGDPRLTRVDQGWGGGEQQRAVGRAEAVCPPVRRRSNAGRALDDQILVKYWSNTGQILVEYCGGSPKPDGSARPRAVLRDPVQTLRFNNV